MPLFGVVVIGCWLVLEAIGIVVWGTIVENFEIEEMETYDIGLGAIGTVGEDWGISEDGEE